MKEFRGKKIENLGGISAEVVVVRNKENGKRIADTIGLLLGENSLQIELSRKQAIGLAVSLLEAAYKECSLNAEYPPYGEVAQCLPIFAGNEKSLLGYLLALNNEHLHDIATTNGEIEYIATKENLLRLIRLILKEITKND